MVKGNLYEVVMWAAVAMTVSLMPRRTQASKIFSFPITRWLTTSSFLWKFKVAGATKDASFTGQRGIAPHSSAVTGGEPLSDAEYESCGAKTALHQKFFPLPRLPYKFDALAPAISATNLEVHHCKHHAGYATALYGLVKDNVDTRTRDLRELIVHAHQTNDIRVYRNACQLYNHAFYFAQFAPATKSPEPVRPTGLIAQKIDRAFGSFDSFRDQLVAKCLAHFASGWVWLVVTAEDQLLLVDGHDADNPLITHPGAKPLLTIDVWEHAYYLTNRNMRGTYVKDVIDSIIDWNFVNERLASSGFFNPYSLHE